MFLNQKEERERMAQRALSPDRSLRPDKLRENRPLPVDPPASTPEPGAAARMPKFQGTPTLLLLGNPVYGCHEQVGGTLELRKALWETWNELGVRK